MSATSSKHSTERAVKSPRTPAPKKSAVKKIGIKELRRMRPSAHGKTLTLAEFQALKHDGDGWKYEWNNGRVEVNETAVNSGEKGVLNAIMRAFTRTVHFEEGWMYLDVHLNMDKHGVVRVADLVYFTEQQYDSFKRNEHPIPSFIVEVVHPHDFPKAISNKIAEYFQEGVKCVWVINLETKRVRVYTSPDESILVRGNGVCSGYPALPDFSCTPNQLFV
jgi:Uma2 family endonuclease